MTIRAFVPTVVGSGQGRRGNDFDRFIQANIECINMEPGRVEADFMIGFGGMRRIEMVKIARKHGLEIDENSPGEEIKSRMETWFLEGKFPIPEPAENIDQEAMEKRVEERLMKKLGLIEGPPREAEVESLVQVEEPAEISPPREPFLSSMTWAALKKEAARLDVFHVSLKRPELEERVLEARQRLAA